MIQERSFFYELKCHVCGETRYGQASVRVRLGKDGEPRDAFERQALENADRVARAECARRMFTHLVSNCEAHLKFPTKRFADLEKAAERFYATGEAPQPAARQVEQLSIGI